MSYRCRWCDEVFSEIPLDCTVIAGHGTSALLIKTADGRNHDLKLIRPITERQHLSRHKKNKTDIMCRWCYPEPKAQQVQTSVQEEEHEPNQTPTANEQDPTPQEETTIGSTTTGTSDYSDRGEVPLESLPEPEEVDPGGTTAFKLAFDRLFKNQQEDPWDEDSQAKF